MIQDSKFKIQRFDGRGTSGRETRDYPCRRFASLRGTKQSSTLFDGQKYDNLVEWVNYSFIFRKTSLTRRIKICQIAEW